VRGRGGLDWEKKREWDWEKNMEMDLGFWSGVDWINGEGNICGWVWWGHRNLKRAEFSE
jgi:hypothetical protein